MIISSKYLSNLTENDRDILKDASDAFKESKGQHGVLVRKVLMDCPICDKKHEVEEKKRISTVEIKGIDVSYEERYFFCGNADEDENEFVNGKMMDENLARARESYRDMKDE